MWKPNPKFETECHKHVKILEQGLLLGFDPASGKSSRPGFAEFDALQFVRSGTISVPQGKPHARFFHILQDLQQMQPPDVFIVEKVPINFHGGGGGQFMSNSWITLHRSIGVALAVFGEAVVIEVPVPTWKSFQRWHCPSYEKTDENDALILVLTTLAHAGIDVGDPDKFFKEH